MMKKIMLLIALTILGFAEINAQVVTIGTGVENDDGLPIEPYNSYSYSQCLYLASEINQTGNIYRIKYKGKAGISISSSNDWTIYMGHTSNTTLVSNSWIPTSAMTQVFTGTITVVNDNVEITLTTPFNYNGTDNLVIAIDENQTGYDGSNDDFLSTNVTGQRSLLFKNDVTNPDPANPPSTTIGQSAIANIDLDFNATACNAPTALSATNITTNSADISWTAGGTETSWQVEHGTVGFTLGTGTTVSSTSHTLSGLNPGTVYQYYVKADCGSGATSGWAGPFTFTTTCVPYSIPYFEGFENAYTHEGDIGICFTQESIDGTPKWVGDDNTSNSSSLHAPRTGNWNALLYSGNKDWLFIPVQLTGGTSYTMELYARYSTSATPASTISINYGTNADSSSMTNTIVAATTITNAGYQKLEGNFTPTTSGTYYVGIYGQALSFSFGYMTLDDISIIETPSCVKPSALSTNAITSNSANLNWTAGGSGGTSWQIEYGTTGFAQGTGTTVVTSTNPHTLSGLSPETTYDWYIREICGAGDTSVWTVVQTFTTDCAATTSFPFTEEFETITTGQPNCWGIAGTTTNASFHWNSFGTGETGRGIRFNSYHNANGRTSELTTPTLDLSSLSTAQLSFYFKNPTGGNFEVLISTDGGTTYTSLENNLTGQASWLEKTYNITSHIGNNVKIQFKGTSNYGSGDAYVYLDGVEVKEVPSCVAPTSLTTNNITATSVDLAWTAGGSGTSWQIEYDTTGFTQGTGTTAITSSNPHSLSGLTANTSYDWYVREICGAGDTSAWTSVNTFTTACSAIANFNENFDGTPTSTLPNCWSKIIDNGASSGAKVEVSTFSTAHSGSKHIRMYNATSPATANIVLVSPLLSNLNAGTHWLRFYAKNSYATEDIQVGTMSNPTDASTFTSLQTIDINGTYTEHTVNFNTYSGTDQYIAIRRVSTVSYTTVYLDDIIWEATPSCIKPTSLTTSNITATSVDLGWTAGGSGGTSWQIEYGATGFTQGTGTTAITSSNPHSLSGLTANTSYDWYIREICGAGDTSAWTSVNTFTTACAIVTDFNENFESATTPNLPNCWSAILDNGATSYAHIQTATSSNPVSGTKHVKLYNSSSPDTSNIILVSPQVSNLSAGTHQLRFYAKNVANTTQDIEVGTVTNPADGSTFSSLQSVDIDGTYTEYTVNFSAYSGTDQYIAIRRLSTHNYSYVWLDDIVWEVIPSCPQPLTSSLNASNITTTSVDLGWTAGGSETVWSIEYGTAGFTQGTGTTIATTTTNPYSLTGLTGTTSYDFYVRGICGAGDSSTWAGPFTFSTACATVTTFPFVEEFEGITTGQPNCWGIAGTTTNVNYHWFSHLNGSQGRGIRFNSFSNASGNTSELTTPLIDLSSLSTAELKFDYKNPAGGNFEVLISTDGGATYTSLENNLTGQTSWLEKTYDITSYIGSNVKIQFKGTSNYANGDAYVYLDGVEVRTNCSPTTGTDVQTTCGTFTWIDGNVYTSSNNTATHTLTNAAGCDSVVTLDLTVNTVNISTSVSDLTITAGLSGATYQWINCADSSVIAGETAQSFTATANGNYAVIITEGSCSDTSACTTINDVSIKENTISFSIHPNPTTGKVIIETNESVQLIEIFSTTGQKVASFTEKSFSIETMKKGVYFVKVLSNNGVAVKRIVRK